jgi:tripartite-type tricarboxylate transporter receptor subunit TctC
MAQGADLIESSVKFRSATRCPLLPQKQTSTTRICSLIAGVISLLSALKFPVRPPREFLQKPRTVRLIVPSAAGGTTDIVARTIAQALSQSLGVSFIVEQKVGGNTNIGSAFVSRAPPDGYTLLVNTDTLTSNASMYRDPGYNVITDFAPVTMLTKAAGALVVRKSLGVSTVEQFAELARKKGKDLLVASTGTGTVSHLTGLLFRQRMDLPEWTDVPYQGAAAAITDLLGNHVDAIVAMIPNFVSQSESGDIKLIAVTTKTRSPIVPDVPTIAEATALKDFDVANWTALFAPANTPKPITEKLAEDVSKLLNAPNMVERLSALGLEPIAEGPEALAQAVRTNVAQWRDVVQRAGLKTN